MADYLKVYAVFVTYAAEPTQANYNELWVVCWQRMRALCISRYGPFSDCEDVDDIINDATLRVLAKVQSLNTCNNDTLSRTFYWSMRSAAEHIFRKKTRQRRLMSGYLKDVEAAAKIIFKN